MNWKKITLWVVVVLLVLVGGAYAYFKGRRYVYTFTEAQLREKLEQRLPFTRSYFKIFQVNLENPRINLEEGSDRIHAGMDVRFNIRSVLEEKDLGGSVDASGSLRYVPETGEFFLTNPVVHRLQIDGLPAKYTDKATVVVTKGLEEYYAERPIYSLSKSTAKHMAAKLLLKSVVTRDETLIVTLGL